MHPILSDLRKLLFYILVCLLAGALVAGLLQSSQAAAWPQALVFAMPLCLLYGFVVLSAYYVCRALPYAERHFAAEVGLFGAAILLSAAAGLGLALAWNACGQIVGLEPGWIILSSNLRRMLFAAGAVLYLLSILAHDVLIAFENLRDAMTREAESRQLASDAELRMLRSQIDPHFLFNSLNSISALTSLDPVAARDMAIDLAQFFRSTLALSARNTIALSEEMALCEHYLAIEKRRFGAKLKVTRRIDPSALGCWLPPMSLQPLLENALKHGIRQLDAGGTVTIEAQTHGPWLFIAVSNPIAPHASDASGAGFGLKNGRARLAAQYGERARLAWQQNAGQFKIEMTIPQPEDKVT